MPVIFQIALRSHPRSAVLHKNTPPKLCPVHAFRSSSMFIHNSTNANSTKPQRPCQLCPIEKFYYKKAHLSSHQSSPSSESSLHLDSSPSSPPPNPSSPHTLSSILSVITVSCLWICFRTRSRSGSRDARCSCWFRWASMGRVARSMVVVRWVCVMLGGWEVV
jgi:hypothetical protein